MILETWLTIAGLIVGAGFMNKQHVYKEKQMIMRKKEGLHRDDEGIYFHYCEELNKLWVNSFSRRISPNFNSFAVVNVDRAKICNSLVQDKEVSLTEYVIKHLFKNNCKKSTIEKTTIEIPSPKKTIENRTILSFCSQYLEEVVGQGAAINIYLCHAADHPSKSRGIWNISSNMDKKEQTETRELLEPQAPIRISSYPDVEWYVPAYMDGYSEATILEDIEQTLLDPKYSAGAVLDINIKEAH